MMGTNGFFITFEGGEGCGKTTQIPLLAQALRQNDPGREVLEARSPGGTAVAEKMRRILKEPTPGEDLLPETELLLFAACHSQMSEYLIRPALQRGAILLSDRFVDSTIVYQGLARGLDVDVIRRMNEFAVKGTRPDLTLVLDIDPKLGVRRAGLRGEGADRFDSEKMSFHQKVRAGFLTLAKAEPERFVVIDAAPDKETVARAIREAVHARLGLL